MILRSRRGVGPDAKRGPPCTADALGHGGSFGTRHAERTADAQDAGVALRELQAIDVGAKPGAIDRRAGREQPGGALQRSDIGLQPVLDAVPGVLNSIIEPQLVPGGGSPGDGESGESGRQERNQQHEIGDPGAVRQLRLR